MKHSLSPPELLAGDDGVVLGERFIVDGGFDFGQQTIGSAALVRFGCRRVALVAGPASRLPGVWTFWDHGVVYLIGATKKVRRKTFTHSLHNNTTRRGGLNFRVTQPTSQKPPRSLARCQIKKVSRTFWFFCPRSAACLSAVLKHLTDAPSRRRWAFCYHGDWRWLTEWLANQRQACCFQWRTREYTINQRSLAKWFYKNERFKVLSVPLVKKC